MKLVKIFIALIIVLAPTAASAQMRMHQGMKQDSTGYGNMQVNQGMRGMMMSGCMNMMHPNMMQGNMMGQGMMMGRMNRGMMGNSRGMMGMRMPMHTYMMMVNYMPAMQQKLSLSDDQVSKLIDIQTTFKKKRVDYQANLARERMKLKSLLKENASPGDIREHLQKCSGIMTDMQVDAYEAYINMKDGLNDSQKEQLNGMMSRHMGNSNMMDW